MMALLSSSRVPKRSGNHPALEHFIGDGSRNLVDELGAHLWIIVEQLNRSLFLGFRRSFLASLFPQLLTGGTLVFLDDFFRYSVYNRVVLWRLSLCFL
jgi:hypothetical protein